MTVEKVLNYLTWFFALDGFGSFIATCLLYANGMTAEGSVFAGLFVIALCLTAAFGVAHDGYMIRMEEKNNEH